MWETYTDTTISIWDYVLLPLYLVAIYAIFYGIRNKLYPEGHPWRPYFIRGLTLKIAGAIFVSLLYVYYYPGGDTLNYFHHSQVINGALSESFGKWLNLVFHIPSWYDPEYIQYTSQLFWYTSINNYAVGAVSAFISLFTFNTYLPTAVIFAALSYTGIWAMFRTFATQYPALAKHIALVILFIPSTFIWGSGIFKDTICMFALGWMVHGIFTFFIQKKFKPITIALTVVSFYMVTVIKIYILIAFVPAIGLWIAFTYSNKIKMAFFRTILRGGFLALSVVGFLYASTKLNDELGQYSLDKITETSNVTKAYIYSVSGESGSGYNVGVLQPTFSSIIKIFPLAVNVSLFRPYVWEAKKPIVLLNALEAFIFLLMTLKILIYVGPAKCWKAITGDANIQFSLIFTLIFAFAVGVSSGNFGALSRYRIPCLPLYGLSLVLIYYKYNSPDKKFLTWKKK